jgi:hypothetical protein
MTFEYALRHKRTPQALPLVLCAPLLPPRRLPQRPIFVVGCPRSGNTVLFQLLRTLPDVATIGHEGHILWDTFHPLEAVDYESHALGPKDIRSFEHRYLAWIIPALAGKGTFLDKTPRNVLRLPYLNALFPDARYVFVRRDPRGSISSLIIGWRRQQVRGSHLPGPFQVQGMPERRWFYLLTPGWRSLNGRTVEEVCAHQYLACQQAIDAFTPALDPGRFTEVRYEDLLTDPVAEVKRIAEAVQTQFDPTSAEALRGVVRPDPPDKWRTRTPEEIERVMPLIAPTLERLGYPA